MKRRGLLLGAAVCALLAAGLSLSYTSSHETTQAEAAVLVAERPLRRGVSGDELAARVTTRRVAAGCVAPDAISDPADLAGRRPVAALPAGSLLTASMLTDGEAAAGTLRRGERALSVNVVVSPATAEVSGGELVDLYASGFGGAQQTTRLINGAEVLAVEPVGSRQRLTLRLAAAQVGPVVRGDVFARELRAVVLPER